MKLKGTEFCTQMQRKFGCIFIGGKCISRAALCRCCFMAHEIHTKEGVLGKTIFSKGGLQHDYTIVGPTGVLRHDLTLTHVFYKKRIIE